MQDLTLERSGTSSTPSAIANVTALMDASSFTAAARLLARRSMINALFSDTLPVLNEDAAGGAPMLNLHLPAAAEDGPQQVWIGWHAAFRCPALWVELHGGVGHIAMLSAVERLLRERWVLPAVPHGSGGSATSLAETLCASLSVERHPHLGSGGAPCVLLHPCRTPELLAEGRSIASDAGDVGEAAVGASGDVGERKVVVGAGGDVSDLRSERQVSEEVAPVAAGKAMGFERAYWDLLAWCSLMLPCVGIDVNPVAFAAEVRRIREAHAQAQAQELSVTAAAGGAASAEPT